MSTGAPHRPAPPRPAPLGPKPGLVKVVRSLYKYDAQYSDELSFEEGEMLYIIDMTDNDWWKAKCGNRVGLVPRNYVGEQMEAVENPMHEAAKRGNISFLEECLANKIGINGLDKAGSTALHWAAHGGHMECLTALLAVPTCQVNVANKLGDTPLHSAAWRGHSECVKILLERGARWDMKNNEGKTALQLTKDAATAALIQQAGRNEENNKERIFTLVVTYRPRKFSTDYGGEDDSD